MAFRDASPILAVRVQGPAGERECYVDFEDMIQSPGSLLPHVRRLAEELLPAGSDVRATYLDDEGDACTLVDSTAVDAIHMARQGAGGEDALKELVITVEATASQSPTSAAPSADGFSESVQAATGQPTSESQVEPSVRWQFLVEESESSFLSPGRLPRGWHSYGPRERQVLEQRFREGTSSVPRTASIRPASAIYDYEIDFLGMTQKNLSTGKVRQVRRSELAFRREVVGEGREFGLEVELAQGEAAHWAWEVEDDLEVAFEVVFVPAAEAAGPAADAARGRQRRAGRHTIEKGTHAASAWSFMAPQAGSVQLSWKNASPRVLCVDCHKAPARPADDQRDGERGGEYGSERNFLSRAGSALAMCRAAVSTATGQDEYHFGDITRAVVAKFTAASVPPRDAPPSSGPPLPPPSSGPSLPVDEQHQAAALGATAQVGAPPSSSPTQGKTHAEEGAATESAAPRVVATFRKAGALAAAAQVGAAVKPAPTQVVATFRKATPEEEASWLHVAPRQPCAAAQGAEAGAVPGSEYCGGTSSHKLEESQSIAELESVRALVAELDGELSRTREEAAMAAKRADVAERAAESAALEEARLIVELESVTALAAQRDEELSRTRDEAAMAVKRAEAAEALALASKSSEREAHAAEQAAKDEVGELRRMLRAASEELPALGARALAADSAMVHGACAGASARVVGCEHLLSGCEAREDGSARGDVTGRLGDVVARAGARGAFCLGRVCLATSATDAAPVPVSAQVTVANDGVVAWPETVALVLVSGPPLGLPLLQLGAIEAGEGAEVILDLVVPPSAKPSESRSVWSVADAATGRSLGPLLVFYASWEAE